jgi:DHA2 family multidrug resistance protein-like MFS transporter
MDDMASTTSRGTNRLLVSMCLAVSTYWFFGGALNPAIPAMAHDLRTGATAVTAALTVMGLFCGVLIVACGTLADRLGRVRLARIGLVLAAAGAGWALWPMARRSWPSAVPCRVRPAP